MLVVAWRLKEHYALIYYTIERTCVQGRNPFYLQVLILLSFN